MKRILSLILTLCLFVLCGCGTAAAPVQETVEPISPSSAPAEMPADAPDLTQILGEIRDRMHPGTAGSSLTAAQLAVLLLDWSVQTPMDEEQIRASVEDFLAPMIKREQTEFAMQMSAVGAAVERLRGEDGEALMDDIGGTDGTRWPWTDAPQEKLDALFSAAG